MDVQAFQKKDALAAMFNKSVSDEFDKSDGIAAWRGGVCLGAAGLIEKWHGTAVAYAFLSTGAGPYLGRFSRRIVAFLDQSEFRRIELLVAPEFDQGRRWARLLGFELETPLARCYDPGGNDYAIYTRVKA